MGMRVRGVGVSIAASALMLAAGATAHSTPGSTDSGYSIALDVVLSGDAAPSNGSYRIWVPPVCWWEYVTDDMQYVQDVWYGEYRDAVGEDNHGSYVTAGMPMPSTVESWVQREADGEDLTMYQARCRNDGMGIDTGAREQWINQFGFDTSQYSQNYVAFTVFPTVIGEPAPAIDPEDLALAARELMVLEEPDFERNPKVGAVGGGTFVNIATWFWLTDPDALGDAAGQRTIRADVVGTPVWAEVTASTGGLTINSPVGTWTCTRDQARTAWAPGVSESSACTVDFGRASVGYADGYPVTAQAVWTAQWQGQDIGGNAEGGDLPPVTISSDTVNIPVAEVQTRVSALD